VNDLGWFAELPDDVALKVPAGGDDEVDVLAAALRALSEPGVAARMGEAARAYAAREHDLDAVAEQYTTALELAAGGAAVEAKVGRAVAVAAADAGLPAEALAPELAELGLLSRNGHEPLPSAARGTLRTLPTWLWLAGLYVTAVGVQLALGVRVVSPWIMVDELVYSDMARSFADHGRFLIRGEAADYGFVYPLLISPAWWVFGFVGRALQAAQGINALVMCSVVFPTYLLARRVVKPGYALAASALAVAVPPMIYVGTLMTENAFYPVFMWLAYALYLALERPTARRQLVLLAVCVVAFLTRAQAVALVAAVLTAPLVLAWIERGRPRRLSAWKWLYGITIGAGIVVVLVEVARGKSPSQLLGGYSVTTENGTYHFWPSLRWILYHVAALDLSLFVIPFAAFIVLVASARHLDRGLRVFCAAAAPLVVWLTLEVGVFASAWSFRIEERNLFYVAPLFLIALFAWLERGQPRPARAVVAAAVVAAALPAAIPFVSLMNINAQSDTLFIQPWWYLGDRVAGLDNVGLLVMLASIGLAAAFLWLSPRYAPLLPALVALGFFLTWLPLQLWTHSFPRLSVAAYSTGIGLERSWVDNAVGRDADVTLVWAGENPYRGWENEFWNRSVRRVYDLGGDTLLAGSSEPRLTIERQAGTLLDPSGKPLRASYVLAGSAEQIVGEKIAEDAAKQMTLYRVDGVVRTRVSVSGWYPDTWTEPHAEWVHRDCTNGELRVPLRTSAGPTQTVMVGGTAVAQSVRVSEAAPTTLVVQLLPVGGICRVTLDVSPVRRAVGDPRTLGVLAEGFQYVPAANG
jgi:hypothetical protein